MPASRRFAGTRVMSSPSTSTVPGVGLLEAGDDAQRGRLAAARTGRAARRSSPGSTVEVEAVEGDGVAEGPAQPSELDSAAPVVMRRHSSLS